MLTPVSDLSALLCSLQPQLHQGVYAFVSLPGNVNRSGSEIIAAFHEPEGWSAIVAEQVAKNHHWQVALRAAWITLAVNSDLHAVGLTAAVSTALAAANISCNIVAAVHHDHLFVPCDRAQAAMQVLHDLQYRAASGNEFDPPS